MKIIGHRGARGLAPENTLASINKALEHNVDEIEVDLRVTKDLVVILHHNPYLGVQNGPKLNIKKSTLSELLAHKQDLVTLDEVLRKTGNKVPFYMEVKPKELIKPIVKVINSHLDKDWKSEHFRLGSKSQKTLLELHKALPEIQKIVIEPWSGVRAHIRARQVNTKRISMNQLWLWSGFIKSVARSGYKLYPYTLNDPVKAARWQRYGIAGIITDYPDLFDKN